MLSYYILLPYEFIILIIVSVPKLLKLKVNCEHVLYYNYNICLCDQSMWPVIFFYLCLLALMKMFRLFFVVGMGCPNKSARFKVCVIVVLLGWRHWKFNICHLSLLRLVVVEGYNKEQRIIIVKMHYKYGESYVETVRKFCGIFGRQNAPYQSTVQRMNKKFEERGSIMDSKLPVPHHTGRSLDNSAAVHGNVAESPGTSIRHCSQQLDISRSTMQQNLMKDLHLHAYKIQLTQELKPTDHV